MQSVSRPTCYGSIAGGDERTSVPGKSIKQGSAKQFVAKVRSTKEPVQIGVLHRYRLVHRSASSDIVWRMTAKREARKLDRATQAPVAAHGDLEIGP